MEQSLSDLEAQPHLPNSPSFLSSPAESSGSSDCHTSLPKSPASKEIRNFDFHSQLTGSVVNQRTSPACSRPESPATDTQPHTSAAPFTSEELQAVFANLRDVHAFNSALLAQLQQSGLHVQRVADCFVRNGPGFHVYAAYCTQYPESVDTLSELTRRPAAQAMLRAAQQRLAHPLPLAAYLLKPVQRILKYHLLLSALLDRLMASQPPRPAEQPLRHALALMSEIAAHINRVKRKHEHALRLQQLQHVLLGWQVSKQ